MKISKIWSIAALVLSVTLAACGGGGGDDASVTVHAVAKSEIEVKITSFDCRDEGEPLYVGQEGRPVECFYILSDADVMLAHIPVSMMGSVSVRQVTNVSLLASLDKGMQDLSGRTGFGPDGKLTLKTDFRLSRGVPVVMRIVADIPSFFDSAEGSVTFNFGSPEFEYDKAAYSGIKIVGVLEIKSFQVKNVPEPIVSSDMVSSTFPMGQTRFVLMSGKVANLGPVPQLIEGGAVYIGSNFDTAPSWMTSCISSMQVNYYKDGYWVGSSMLSQQEVSSYNEFTSGVVVPAGEQVHVQVTAESIYCTAPMVGAMLSTYLQLQVKYLGLHRLPASVFVPMGAIQIPFVDGKG